MDKIENPELWATTVAHLMYEVTAKHVPDTTTLGELRVLTVIAMAAVTGSAVTTKEISTRTSIPPYRISRIVARYLENGALEEKPHPSDGRSKQICFREQAFELNKKWSNGLHRAIAQSGLL